MDMMRATIFEENINDKLSPELVLAITYIKNNRPTRALQNLSPHKVHSQEPSNLTHLQIFGSIVYILLHKEEQSMKSEKWALGALKRVLIGYDDQTIYWVYIKN